MKKKPIFTGCATALITPFSGDEIDYRALGRLIDIQVAAGIGCLVIGGTTGEAACLGESERTSLYSFARERTAGRCTLVLGTGSCDTERAVRYTKMAARVGADGALCVVPYYNRGTREGVVLHYRRIAEAADIPILLYNVPARTGHSLPLESIAELAECEGIAGIKEAAGSAERLAAIAALGDAMPLYAGNDAEIFTVMALGGLGAVSVASNALPRALVRLCALCECGRWSEARAIQSELLPFISALFEDTNPAPIKALMHTRGLCSSEIRLPLSEASQELTAKLSELYGALLQLECEG